LDLEKFLLALASTVTMFYFKSRLGATMKEAALWADEAAAKILKLRAAIVAIAPIGKVIKRNLRGGRLLRLCGFRL